MRGKWSIMNAVEINVGNLAKWLKGAGPYAGDPGLNVNYANQNGYILYFWIHRGMLVDPNPSNGQQTFAANVISGEAGLEDVVNSAQPNTSTNPDGVKEAATCSTPIRPKTSIRTDSSTTGAAKTSATALT